jgi:acyl CoA:acetate/3-ketoacid CoA transferase beta subunit
VQEILDGVSFDDLQALTGARLKAASEIDVMTVPSL